MWAFPIQLLVRAKRCKRVGRTWPNAERLLDAPLLALCGVAEEVLIAESDPKGGSDAACPARRRRAGSGGLASPAEGTGKRDSASLPGEWASYWATAGQLLGALQHQYPLGLRLVQDQSRRQLQAAVRASMGSSSPGV